MFRQVLDILDFIGAIPLLVGALVAIWQIFTGRMTIGRLLGHRKL